MSDKPLVSYVLTAYNIEEYIEESIQCAFAQTYEPLEIILSDDCSTDKTYEIMQKMVAEYKGPHKIILNRNEQNLGITRHMNKVYIDLAQGEIIIAAHGDDISIAERTQISVDFLLANPEVNAVSGSLAVISADGSIRDDESRNTVVSETRYYDLTNPKKNGIRNIPAPSRAFYKNVMTDFGALSDECPTEDELITFRALLLGKKNAFIPEILVKYRKHKGSSSNAENFSRFPLEKIREQQISDMEVALVRGLITVEDKRNMEEITLRGMTVRKLYRQYYANKTVKTLWQLVRCPLVSFKAKLSYIYRHFTKR